MKLPTSLDARSGKAIRLDPKYDPRVQRDIDGLTLRIWRARVEANVQRRVKLSLLAAAHSLIGELKS